MVFQCKERTSATYTAVLTDAAGAFPALSVLTLKLYDKDSGTVINSRDKHNVLNANGVTYTAGTGTLVWELDPADNAIIDVARPHEEHIALFEGAYNGGARELKHEVSLLVRNLRFVP